MEPICEAKFSKRSYGFRPNRSVEHAVARANFLMQIAHLFYVIEFDIKGFFDNVNHAKLIRQVWGLGIHDKQLIYVLKQILAAPIRMPDGKTVIPQSGTPQGGIISPLLANIVLNELDHWVSSQWEENPVAVSKGYQLSDGTLSKGYGYSVMRSTGLKEMFIVRYADDFRIFCRCKVDAELVKTAVTKWLMDRLHLEVSQEKTCIVNARRQYMEFLGFKIKVRRTGKKKYGVKSHIGDKQLKRARDKLVDQAKRVAEPPKGSTEVYEVHLYNSMVMGLQNYYRLATCVCIDCRYLHRAVMTTFTNRLSSPRGSRLVRSGRTLTKVEKSLYGKSKMLRFLAGSDEPIYPIGYVRHKNAFSQKNGLCQYTAEGRKGLHDNLKIDIPLMHSLMRQPLHGKSSEYADNRISLFSAQWSKCAVTGKSFQVTEDIHCHHKIPIKDGGTDQYGNLILVLEPVHKLIHASQHDTIDKYLAVLNLDRQQLHKLNELRKLVGNKTL